MLLHNPNSDFNLYLSNHVVNMYVKCGSLDYAHQLFDEMPDRNIVSWTALVSGYAQYGRSDECFRVFRDMLIWHRPTEFAFASVISACGGDGDCGRQIMKNIRICVDCHNFMKLASELVDMEIVVGDSNRFHHFKVKVCSCNDYW
ncbi:unnamed protein product, partial [Vitis vinifera]